MFIPTSRFVELTRKEQDCLYHGFSMNGNRFHCREAYAGAAGALTHLENVGPFNPSYWVLEYGFRRA